MNTSQIAAFPNIRLSHFELYVRDVASMEAFYAEHLGFVVTDRGEGPNGMVFLSRNPDEHHQLVLNPRLSQARSESPVDHISFRVDGLADLRIFHSALRASPAAVQTVSHGTTWSIYVRDPEGNRLELFADTPWHVDQPCRFEIDLDLPDDELTRFTRARIEAMPGFRTTQAWKASHAGAVGSTATDRGSPP